MDAQTRLWHHYHKLQEALAEVLCPSFVTSSRSLTFVVMNQLFTSAERLFEIDGLEAEKMSKRHEIMLARLGRHVEDCKDQGFTPAFAQFLKADFATFLHQVKQRHEQPLSQVS